MKCEKTSFGMVEVATELVRTRILCHIFSIPAILIVVFLVSAYINELVNVREKAGA